LSCFEGGGRALSVANKTNTLSELWDGNSIITTARRKKGGS